MTLQLPDPTIDSRPVPAPSRSTPAELLELGVSPADRSRASAQLAEKKPLLLAMQRDEVLAPSVSAERALSLSAYIQTLMPDIAGPYPFEPEYYRDIENLARGELLDDALVYLAAQTAFEATWSLQDRLRKAELQSRVGDHLRFFSRLGRPSEYPWPVSASREPPIVSTGSTPDDARWNRISAGGASFDDPRDLIALVAIVRDNPNEFASRTAITTERLDEARADATELMTFVDRLATFRTESVATDAPFDEERLASELVCRAYSWWAEDYDKVVRVGRFYARAPRTWPSVVNERATPLDPASP